MKHIYGLYIGIFIGISALVLGCEVLSEAGRVKPVEVKLAILNSGSANNQDGLTLDSVSVSLSDLMMYEDTEGSVQLFLRDSVISFSGNRWDKAIVEDYIPEGVFRKFESRFHGEALNSGSQASYSFLIEGSYRGAPFSLEYNEPLGAAFELSPPISILSSEDPLTKLTLFFDRSLWFSAETGGILNPLDSESGPIIFENIRRSIGIEYAIESSACAGNDNGKGSSENACKNGVGNNVSSLVQVSDTTASEEDEFIYFDLHLTEPVDDTVNVSYETQANSAKEGRDFMQASGSVSILPGSVNATVGVQLMDDDQPENREHFTFKITDVAGAYPDHSMSRAKGYIIDNDGSRDNGNGDGGKGNNNNSLSVSVYPAESEEYEGVISFNVELSGPAPSNLSVGYYTRDNSAKAGSDYEGSSGTVHFMEGDQTGEIRVTLMDDDQKEPDEQFTVELINPSEGLDIDNKNARAKGKILNDDEGKGNNGNNGKGNNKDEVKVSVFPSEAVENEGYISFEVKLSEPAPSDLSVGYYTRDNSAKAGSDYEGSSGTIRFIEGDQTGEIRVTIMDDDQKEPDEQFTVVLVNPSEGLDIDNKNARAKGKILNDDEGNGNGGNNGKGNTKDSVKVSVYSSEGMEDIGYMEFELSLSQPAPSTLSVQYYTSDNSAKSGEDYQPSSGTVTFYQGDNQAYVTVNLLVDDIKEPDEQFTLVLENPSEGLDIDNKNARAKGKILNDDEGSGGNGNNKDPVSVSIKPSQGPEDTGYLDFELSLSEPAPAQLSVDYNTSGNSAKAGSDYIETSGTAVFYQGSQYVTISVNLLTDDQKEPDEQFTVSLTNPSEGLAIDNKSSQAKGTILNDDEEKGNGGQPDNELTVSIHDTTASETGNFMTFRVELSGNASMQVTVDYETTGSSAKSGNDFEEQSGQIIFSIGERRKFISVPLIDDNKKENNKKFFVTLSNPSEGLALNNQAKKAEGSITDND